MEESQRSIVIIATPLTATKEDNIYYRYNCTLEHPQASMVLIVSTEKPPR